MPPRDYYQVRFLIAIAIALIISLWVMMFGGVTVFNFNANQINQAFDDRTERIFSDVTPTNSPFIVLVLLFILLPNILAVLFSHLRVVLYVPAERVMTRHSFYILHWLTAISTMLLFSATYYGEILTTTDSEYIYAVKFATLSLYFFSLWIGIEHVLVGLWFIYDRPIPLWVGVATTLTSSAGLVAVLFMPNSDLPPIRLIIGPILLASEVAIWIWFLGLVELPYLRGQLPKPDDEATITPKNYPAA